MKFIAGFLLTFFSKAIEFVTAYLGKKFALGGAVIATSLALITAFWIALKALVAGLIIQITDQTMLMAFYALWPSNAELCISAYWTAHLVAWIYREHRENLKAISYIT